MGGRFWLRREDAEVWSAGHRMRQVASAAGEIVGLSSSPDGAGGRTGANIYVPDNRNYPSRRNQKCWTDCPTVRVAPMPDRWTVGSQLLRSRVQPSPSQANKAR